MAVMNVSVVGKVDRVELGSGSWALNADTGETYELMKVPAGLAEVKSKVKIKGKIREDIMTFAAIGPVLEVESFEVIS